MGLHVLGECWLQPEVAVCRLGEGRASPEWLEKPSGWPVAVCVQLWCRPVVMDHGGACRICCRLKPRRAGSAATGPLAPGVGTLVSFPVLLDSCHAPPYLESFVGSALLWTELRRGLLCQQYIVHDVWV